MPLVAAKPGSYGRYELLAPAGRYAGLHEPAERWLRLGVAATAMLVEEPGLAVATAVQRAAVEESADPCGAPDSADVAFVEAQLLSAGSRVRCLQQSPGWRCPVCLAAAIFLSVCVFLPLKSSHGALLAA